LLNNWASQKESELNTQPPDPSNPIAAGVTPLSKAMGAMDNPAQKLSEKLGNPASVMMPDAMPPSPNSGTPASNPMDSLNSQSEQPPKADPEAGNMPSPPATNGEQKPENQPMPGEKIYPGSSDGQIPAANPPQQPFQNALNPLTPPPSPEMNPMNPPADAQAQQGSPNQLTPPPSPQANPMNPPADTQAQQGSPEDQAKMAEQQYLRDLSGQPKNPNDALAPDQAGMPLQQKPSPSGKSGPVPYEALNQVLVDSEPGYRWNALKEINKAGMAPPDTYNLLCQTAMSDSPLMNPDIPLDTQSQLRQAAFSTLALLDNKQDANIPAIALMKDPKTGRAIKDPKTNQPAYQMLPGLQEAGRALHDKDEEAPVQLAALSFLQKIIQAHPSDRPALLGIIKGYKTRDANVQALARQIQSGKPMPADDPSSDMMNKSNPIGMPSSSPADAQAMQQQPAFKGKVVTTAPRKQFIA
jgi:hypothetical protein